MKSSSAKEGRFVLQKMLVDVKRIVSLVNGPEMGKLIETFEFETFDVKNEIILFINFKTSTLERIIK